MNLTQHFTLAEMIRSGAAVRLNIVNEPSAEVVENLRLLCENILEPLRRRFGVIRITSGYRCQALNQAVGGVGHSQHLCGEAADIHVSNREVGLKMYHFIEKTLPYHQLFFEHRKSDGTRWIHVSFHLERRRTKVQRRRSENLII